MEPGGGGGGTHRDVSHVLGRVAGSTRDRGKFGMMLAPPISSLMKKQQGKISAPFIMSNRRLLVLAPGPTVDVAAVAGVLAGLAERDYTRSAAPSRDPGPPARPQLGRGGHVAMAMVLGKDFWTPPTSAATTTTVEPHDRAGPAATPTRRLNQRRHIATASTGSASTASPAAAARTGPDPRRQSPRGPPRSTGKGGDGSAAKRRRTSRPRDAPGSAANLGGPADGAELSELRAEDWCWPGACPGPSRMPQWSTSVTAKVGRYRQFCVSRPHRPAQRASFPCPAQRAACPCPCPSCTRTLGMPLPHRTRCHMPVQLGASPPKDI